jgi:hypothetical protein
MKKKVMFFFAESKPLLGWYSLGNSDSIDIPEYETI